LADSNTAKREEANSLIGRICNILSTAALFIIILIAGGFLALRIMGYQPMAVLSGSMQPAYHIGDLVFINTNIKPEGIELGQVMTYMLEGDTVVTHRVISIDSSRGLITTKGDANGAADGAAVPFEKVVGIAAFMIPKAGILLLNATTRTGIATISVAAGVILLLIIIPVLLAENEKAIKAKKHAAGDNASA
jgi:signal peptidase